MASRTDDLAAVVEESRAGGSGFRHRVEDDGHRLELWGALPRSWAGNLALHAFARQLSIDSADAVETSPRRWAARFHVAQSDAFGQPLEGDFMQMARRPPRFIPALPVSEVVIDISQPLDESGRVIAWVHGQDSIGLLAQLLERFDSLGLEPSRFALRTAHGQVRDCFWLVPTASRNERLGRSAKTPSLRLGPTR